MPKLENLFKIRKSGNDVMAEAIAWRVPKSISIKWSEPLVDTKGWIDFAGTISNSSAEDALIIVMAEETPLHIQPTLVTGVTYAPSAIRPPSPPAPHQLVVPANSSVEIRNRFGTSQLVYKGAPVVKFNWTLLYWSSPQPTGSWKVVLPKR